MDGDAVAEFLRTSQRCRLCSIVGPEAPARRSVSSDRLRAGNGLATFSALPKPPHELEASKSFHQSMSAPPATLRPRPTATSPTPHRRARRLYPTPKARPSSSRPTASLPAKACSCRHGHRSRSPWSRSTTCFRGQFGAAGAEVVIEEFMDGEEASFFVLVDGAETVLAHWHSPRPQTRL